MSQLHLCDFPECGKQIKKSELQKCIVVLDLSPEERNQLHNSGLQAKPVIKKMELCRKHALEVKKLIFSELIDGKKEGEPAK